MAEELIAEYRWRRRLRDWSNVCDNHLVLDRTSSLDDGPGALNQFGICGPPCDMCVTPFGRLVTVCDLATSLSPYMVLPKQPPKLTLPLPLVASIVPGDFTSTVNSSLWSASKCFRPGVKLANLLERSSTKSFPLSGNEDAGFSSDWKTFGTSVRKLIWYWNRQDFFGVNQVWSRVTTVTRTYEIRVRLVLKYAFSNACAFALFPEYRVAANSTITEDTGFIAGEGNQGGAPNNFTDAGNEWYRNSVFLSSKLNTAVISQAYYLNGQSQYLAELPQLRGNWDPFLFYLGAMGCGPHELYRQVTLDIKHLPRSAQWPYGERVQVTTSDPQADYAYMLKLTGGR